jgi:hypothetical protein
MDENFRKLNSLAPESKLQQRRIEWQKKKRSLVATDAANSLMTASAHVRTAEKLLVAIAAPVTPRQRADKKTGILRPLDVSVVKKQNGS